MPPIVNEIFSFVGILVRFLGFLVFGYAVARFVWDNFKKSEWQVQIALTLGFFGLAVAFTHFATPCSAGAFALGGGTAFLMANMPKKEEGEEGSRKK